MACGNASATTTCLKLATLVIVLVFILQIVGFSIPRWSTLSLSADVYGLAVDTSYHIGLWKDCTCTSVFGTESCYCFSKVYTPEWLKAVKALEVIGLIGLMISLIMTLIILFSRQDKTTKGINIVIASSSGTLIVIGVTVFGIENTEDFEELFAFIETLPYDLDTHGSLSVAFALSTVAGSLCLLVCVPLLVKDYLTPIQTPPMQINPMPIHYNNRGHVTMPYPGQTHVVVNTSVQQPMGYMQSNAYGPPPVYVPQSQPLQPSLASAYPYQLQGQPLQPSQAYPYRPQYGMQCSEENSGMQYKT